MGRSTSGTKLFGVHNDPGRFRLTKEFFSGITVLIHMMVNAPFSGSENEGLKRWFMDLNGTVLQPLTPGYTECIWNIQGVGQSYDQ